MKVADVVCTSGSNGDDMVDVEFDFLLGFTAALALVSIAVKDVFFDFGRDGNSWGFRHFFNAKVRRGRRKGSQRGLSVGGLIRIVDSTSDIV